MAVIDELIRMEEDGSLSFGNMELSAKAKMDGFEYQGDIYKIKTYWEITKLEKNGSMVYESVPGTAVHEMKLTDKLVLFKVEGLKDAQITLELQPETEYKIYVDGTKVGKMKTNLGGKLSFSVELNPEVQAEVKIEKV